MPDKKKKKLIIIDGNALIHRSFHALPDTLTKSDGQLTNAVYGFILVFLKVLNEIDPDYAVAAFDKKGKNFRHKLFKEYKAKRIKAPEELYYQIPMIKKILKAFNVPIYSLKGFEADDLIGTITNQVKNKHKDDLESIIVTGDMDTLQLVDNNTKVFTLRKGPRDTVLYDSNGVLEKLGVEPQQVVDYKALAGDSSDNIPGVPGIGPKSAADLLKKYKNLEEIFKNIEKLPNRIKNKLEKNQKLAELSKKLAQIVLKAPIDFKLQKAAFKNFDKQKLKEILEEFEFKSLIKRLALDKEKKLSKDSKKSTNSKIEKVKIKEIKTLSDWKKWKKNLGKEKQMVLYLFERPLKKTVEKTIFDCELKMAAVKTLKEAENYLINLKEIKPANLFKLIKDKEIYGFGLKKDFELLMLNGISLKEIAETIDFEDQKIIAYLLNKKKNNENLDELLKPDESESHFKKYLDSKKGQTSLALNPEQDQEQSLVKNFLAERINIIADLINEDSAKIKQISEEQKKEGLFPPCGKKDKKYGLDYVLAKIEYPMVKVIAQMELNGIKLDTNKLNQLEKEYLDKAESLKKEVFKLSGSEFNLDSSQQLSKVLYEDLNIPTKGIKKGKSGFYSTSFNELEKLSKDYPIAQLLIKYRELTKLINTYVRPLPNLINQETKRIHTNFNQTVTATGRLSSSNPNLQNIPIRTPEGAKIREAFIADENSSLLSMDYSQIELRIASHYSNDPAMLEIFKKDGDIHTETAAKIHDIPPKKVSKSVRRTAKELNFGLIYGMGTYGFARAAKIGRKEAQEFIEKYKSQFPKMFEYLNNAKKIARKKGYVETIFGRRRYIPEINSRNFQVKSNGERMAVNMPLQGSAADIMKLSLIEVFKYLNKVNLYEKIKPVLSVHDEILFEIENNGYDPLDNKNFKQNTIFKEIAKIKSLMENIVNLKIPLKVDVKSGKNWGDMEEINL
ncbi:MAG: DNA polymerase I [Candidatus Moranbacteria bacterium]|nr:DNA polymerase I [Candidatus Moranbacteria bacterium]